MKELVVISGKGGTGKTSITASFAALAGNCVIADCDVDAADLHLVLNPEIISREDFSGGKRAEIKTDICSNCSRCMELCRFGAVRWDTEKRTLYIDPIACEGCGVCAWFCPKKAIKLFPAVNGECYVSNTRFGPMSHAKLGIAEENSGKLVSVVRKKARELSEEHKKEFLIVDGSPGIGCPVIASIGGADFVLIVTEPTLSGMHDLGRVAELIRHFKIPGAVCVNKWDLNPGLAAEIENGAEAKGLKNAGRVRYDRAVTDAQIRRQTVVEYQETGSAEDIRALWEKTKKYLMI